MEMRVKPCTRCSFGWDAPTRSCRIDTGAEHLPLVPPDEIPACPMSAQCQHQIQVGDQPCAVRARGLVCESALAWAGDADPKSNPISFHADLVASPEDLKWE